MAIALECQGVHKLLGQGVPLMVLHDVSLQVAAGEFVAITGPSGSGKSTLLYLLGALDRPTKGQVTVCGEVTSHLTDSRLAQVRRSQVGFVFQFHFLLPELTARANVMAPMLLNGLGPREAASRAHELLDRFGLLPRAEHRPGQLSGGEQQRVAVARALANRPTVLLGDEPTGNLDRTNSLRVYEELRHLNRTEGQTIVIVTHDPALAALADRRIELVDGRLVG